MPNDTQDWAGISLATFGANGLVAQVSAPSGQSASVGVALPLGTLSVAFRTVVTSGGVVRPAILSINDSSGSQYVVQNPVDDVNWGFAPVVDIAGLNVQLNNTVGAGNTAYRTDVYALPSNAASAFFDRGNQTIVPVANTGTPAPWQAALATPVTQFRNSVGITSLVAGVAGQVIYPHWGQLVVDSGGSCVATIEDDSGGPIILELVPVTNGMVFGSFKGDALPAGHGLRLQVYSLPVAGNVRAILGYSQQ